MEKKATPTELDEELQAIVKKMQNMTPEEQQAHENNIADLIQINAEWKTEDPAHYYTDLNYNNVDFEVGHLMFEFDKYIKTKQGWQKVCEALVDALEEATEEVAQFNRSQ